MDKFKNFVGEALDEVEGVLGRIFDSVKSRDKLSSLFEKLRSMIGLETRQELDDLKEEVEGVNDERNEGEQTENLGEDIESSLGFEENTILFGDSIAVGLGAAVGRVGRGKKNLSILNAKSGVPTKLVRKMLESDLPKVGGKNTILFAGFNDLVGGEQGVDRAFENMTAMVKTVKNAGGKPVLCTLFDVSNPRLNSEDIISYNQKLKEFAKENGVVLVDCFEEGGKWSKASDGLHLTSKGYEQMWGYIKAEVSKQSVEV